MKIGHKQPLQQSLLDRLIDDSPGQPDSGRLRRGFDLKALRQSVRRDLENLLNSRVQWHTWPDSYSELPQSLLNYGLPDFSVMVVDSDEGRLKLCRAVEQAIRRFEPRFKSVKVIHIDNKDTTDRTLKFRIDATLHADPAPEVIVFDSVLDPVFRTVKVEESKHG